MPSAIDSSRFTRLLRSSSSSRWRAAERGRVALWPSSRRSRSQSSQPRSRAKLNSATPVSSAVRIMRMSPLAILPLLLVPEPIDLALEAAFLLDGDPLDHRLALLQILDLVPQPPDLVDQSIVAAAVPPAIVTALALPADPEHRANDAADRHDDHDAHDHFARIHVPDFPSWPDLH